MQYLVTLALFSVALIELLLHRIRRDAGGRVDTRYFQYAGHISAMRLLILALALLGGAGSDHPVVAGLGLTTALAALYFLVLFAYSFPLNKPAPVALQVSLGVTTLAFAALGMRAGTSPGANALTQLLFVVPYFALTIYFLKRNWKTAIRPDEASSQRAPVAIVQAAVVVPWAASLLVYAAIQPPPGQSALPTWVYLTQALVMSLVVVGGISIAVLRYHLFEVRVLMVEVVLAVLASAAFSVYVGLGAAPLYEVLAREVSPAFAATVVAGAPPVIFRSLFAFFERHMNRVASAMTRTGDQRSAVERVLAVTARMVDPDGVLAMVTAAACELTGDGVQFLRAGRVPPGEHPRAPEALVLFAAEDARPFLSYEQAPELPPEAVAALKELDVGMVLPVRRDERLYGFLSIKSRRTPRSVALTCAALADHLAVKLENFTLYAEAALASHELANYKAFLENLVESLPVGVAVVDPELKVQAWNPTLARQTGVAPADAIGKHYFDDLYPGLKDGRADGVIEQLQASPASVVHLPGATSLGGRSDQHLDVTVAPFRDRKGHPNGVVVITQDVTERVRLQRELEESRRLAALGSFAAAIAHDIRTPLTSIQMNVQILRARPWVPDDDREYFDIAIEEIERLNRSVGEILDYAKPMNLSLSPLDPRELVDEVVRALLPVYTEKGVTLETVGGESPPALSGDERRLRQVLVNLLDNAAAASQRGTTVKVGWRQVPEGLALDVEDQGRGIDPEHLERIFEPFFTTRADGTGLGLAIAQKIVRAHGGELRVESERGRGSRFTAVLPLARP